MFDLVTGVCIYLSPVQFKKMEKFREKENM